MNPSKVYISKYALKKYNKTVSLEEVQFLSADIATYYYYMGYDKVTVAVWVENDEVYIKMEY